MKTKIITLLLLSLTLFAFGQQQDICATPDEGSNYYTTNYYSNSIDPAYLDTFDPVVFNIKF